MRKLLDSCKKNPMQLVVIQTKEMQCDDENSQILFMVKRTSHRAIFASRKNNDITSPNNVVCLHLNPVSNPGRARESGPRFVIVGPAGVPIITMIDHPRFDGRTYRLEPPRFARSSRRRRRRRVRRRSASERPRRRCTRNRCTRRWFCTCVRDSR